MAEVRDLGQKLVCGGAEGGSKVRTPYMVILLSQIIMFMHTWKQFVNLLFSMQYNPKQSSVISCFIKKTYSMPKNKSLCLIAKHYD